MVIFVCWEIVVIVWRIPEFLLPAPHFILQRLIRELPQPYLISHIWITFVVSLHGLLQGIGIGVAVGWIFFHNAFIRQYLSWIVMGSQAVPVIALAPLFLIWIPESYWARVWVATIITFFPMYAATYTGLTRIAVELREVAQLYGASRWQTLLSLERYQAAPVIMAGMRTSMALATTGAVVGEFLGGRDGLGALINIARGLFDTTLVFVSITLLVVITLIFHVIIGHISKRVNTIADGTD